MHPHWTLLITEITINQVTDVCDETKSDNAQDNGNPHAIDIVGR